MRARHHRLFADRRDGGRRLAALVRDRQWTAPIVLGLVRGGVPVAVEVATELDAEVDVVVAAKIGAPGRPELGVGAVTAAGPPYYDQDTVNFLGLRPADLEWAGARTRATARQRVARYRREGAPVAVHGRDVLVVDDGLATGVTATAALRAVRERAPATLVFAVPVAALQAAARLEREADEVISVARPTRFIAVSAWYRDFTQISDDEVGGLLRLTRR